MECYNFCKIIAMYNSVRFSVKSKNKLGHDVYLLIYQWLILYVALYIQEMPIGMVQVCNITSSVIITLNSIIPD